MLFGISLFYIYFTFLECMFPASIVLITVYDIPFSSCLTLFFVLNVDTFGVKRRAEFISLVLHKWCSFESTDRKRN